MQIGHLSIGILFGGAICVIFLVLFLVDVRAARYVPLFSTEWKGLGGGLGGWRVSRSLTFVLVAVLFGMATLALIAQKLAQDHTDVVEQAKREYDLRNQRESDERKYHDADLARQAELEKAKIGATTGTAGKGKGAAAADTAPKR